MTRPWPSVPLRDLLAVFCAAGLVHFAAAGFVARPGYMDAYYYFGGAVQLARGQGFTEPYLWNYLAVDLSPGGASQWQLPVPSHLYWMPLTSIVAAPFVALAGAGRPLLELFRAAQIPAVLLSSLMPVLGYVVARFITEKRRHAFTAAALTLFSGFFFLYWTNTDSFSLYGLTGGGALLCLGLALAYPTTSPRRFWFLAGLLCGLAHLTRADGVLLLLLSLVVASYHVLRLKPGLPIYSSLFTLYAFLLLGYLLPTVPWFLRNWFVVGSPLAPGAGRALWLADYNSLFNYPASNLTLTNYLSQGWATLGAGRWWAFTTNLTRLMAEPGLIVATPFILLGLWRLRREAVMYPALLYLVGLFGLMTFVFPFPGARGGLFHSSAALLPFLYPAASVGLDAAVEAGTRAQRWVVARLAVRWPTVARLFPPWQPEKSQPIFTLLLVLFVISLTSVIFYTRLIGPDWRAPKSFLVDAVYAEVGQWLEQAADPRAIVLVNDPPGFYFFTEHPSLIIPNGDADTLIRLMRDFGARWVVLDVNHPAGLATLYQSPASDPRLALRATFTDAIGQTVYLLEFVAP